MAIAASLQQLAQMELEGGWGGESLCGCYTEEQEEEGGDGAGAGRGDTGHCQGEMSAC